MSETKGKIMVKPLPTILDEMDKDILAVKEAVDRAFAAALKSEQAAGIATQAAEEARETATVATEKATAAARVAADEAIKAATIAEETAKDAVKKAEDVLARLDEYNRYGREREQRILVALAQFYALIGTLANIMQANGESLVEWAKQLRAAKERKQSEP